MATHAPTQNALPSAPFFAAPTTTLHVVGTPRWTELEPDLQQALVRLLTRLIGNHLPGPRARDGKGVADDPRSSRGGPARQDPKPPSGALGDRLCPAVAPPAGPTPPRIGPGPGPASRAGPRLGLACRPHSRPRWGPGPLRHHHRRPGRFRLVARGDRLGPRRLGPRLPDQPPGP